jgi:hypothetical protein
MMVYLGYLADGIEENGFNNGENDASLEVCGELEGSIIPGGFFACQV